MRETLSVSSAPVMKPNGNISFTSRGVWGSSSGKNGKVSWNPNINVFNLAALESEWHWYPRFPSCFKPNTRPDQITKPQTQKLAIGVLYPHQLSFTHMSRCSSLCVDSMDIAEWIMTQLLSNVVTTIINYYFGNGLDDPFLLKYGDGKILGLPHVLSFSSSTVYQPVFFSPGDSEDQHQTHHRQPVGIRL